MAIAVTVKASKSDRVIEFPIRVTPKSSRNQLSPYDPAHGWVGVKVTAVPEDGKANKAVLALLSKTLKVPKSSLAIVIGETSRNKVIQIQCGASAGGAEERSGDSPVVWREIPVLVTLAQAIGASEDETDLFEVRILSA